MADMNPLGTYGNGPVVPFSMARPWDPGTWSNASSTPPTAVAWSMQPDGEYTTREAMARRLLRPDLYSAHDRSRGPERPTGGDTHRVLGAMRRTP